MYNLDKFFTEIHNGKHANKLLVTFFGSPNFVLVSKKHLDRYINDDNVTMIIDGSNGNLISKETK